MRFSRIWFIACFSISAFVGAPGAANQALHEEVKDSLVQLEVSGTARVGPSLGTIVESKGTGFFVGKGGYILTTAHFFNKLKDANAANTKIAATFKGTGTGSVEALYVSEIASLDLVLLRAIVTNSIEIPPSLKIGHSEDVDLDDPELLTSGYDLTGYRTPPITFNSTSNSLANFAWTLNGKSNAGSSGSPVYIDKDGAPLVVGVIKATAKDDDAFSLMIPIENSFQLIGQFKLQELTQEVARLRTILGNIDEPHESSKPISGRVVDIEDALKEIESSFSWTAEANDRNGSIVVKYEKILSDGPQVDEIIVKVKPYLYVVDADDETRTNVEAGLTQKAVTLKRKTQGSGARTGTFVLPGMQEKLTEIVMNAEGTYRDQDPLRDIDINIKADIGDVEFVKKLTIVPKFNWVFDGN